MLDIELTWIANGVNCEQEFDGRYARENQGIRVFTWMISIITPRSANQNISNKMHDYSNILKKRCLPYPLTKGLLAFSNPTVVAGP